MNPTNNISPLQLVKEIQDLHKEAHKLYQQIEKALNEAESLFDKLHRLTAKMYSIRRRVLNYSAVDTAALELDKVAIKFYSNIYDARKRAYIMHRGFKSFYNEAIESMSPNEEGDKE